MKHFKATLVLLDKHLNFVIKRKEEAVQQSLRISKKRMSCHNDIDEQSRTKAEAIKKKRM